MRPTSISVSSQATSSWVPVDYTQTPFNLGIQVSTAGETTGLAWKVEYTLDDIFDPAVTPIVNTAPDPLNTGTHSADEVGSLTIPCRAVRLNVTSYTDGTCTMTIVQGRN